MKSANFGRLAIISLAVASTVGITGCAGIPGGDAFGKAPVYSPSDAFRGAESRVVTIRSMNPVLLKKSPQGSWQAIAAPGAAAAVGGIVGGQAGKNGTAASYIGAIIGAAGGGFLGSSLFEARSEVPAIEFNVSYVAQEGVKPRIVTMSVVQEADSSIRQIAPGWQPGARLVPVQARMVRTSGGERIVPL